MRVANEIMFQSLFYWNLLSYSVYDQNNNGIVEFQSLFYWNLLSYLNRTCKPRGSFLVSILVLLEPPLIPFLYILLYNINICFNPCFTGTSSHTYRKGCCWLPQKMFQSLFYWNLLSYKQVNNDIGWRVYVSILVLLEPPLIH